MAGDENHDSNRIVSTWSDHLCATGESYYKTKDGRVWKTCSPGHYAGTGETLGHIRRGRIETA
jgi:hypothetical protein